MPDEQNQTIGGVAKATGVGVEAIRSCQRRGSLPTPRRQYGHVRRYRAAEVERLRCVKRAQRVGFSLDEVKGLPRLDDGTHCNKAAAIATARLVDVRVRVTDLRRIESALSELLRRCRTHRDKVSCPLIAALHAGRTISA